MEFTRVDDSMATERRQMAPQHENHPDERLTRRIGAAGWVALVILFGLLGAVLWYALMAWGMMGQVGISTAGWIFLVAGIVFTVGLGAGLMALLFYSSRKGRDF